MIEMNKLGGKFTLPGTTLTVNRVGYGAMQLAGPGVFGPPKNRDAAIEVLKEVIALGINHIDTSDYYGPFVTNQLIREVLHPYNDDLVIVTKVGAVRGDDASWNPAQAPDDLKSAIDDNLMRLGLDAIDIVNMRFMGDGLGPGEGPIKEQMKTLANLQRQGLVRHIGVSNATARQISDAREIVDIVCVQNHYNLAHRGDDSIIVELAADGIAYVPFFPLGGFSPLQSQTLSIVAESLGATPMQVALAWLLQRSSNILLIPGTSSVKHLHENVGAAEIELPADKLEELNGIVRDQVN